MGCGTFLALATPVYASEGTVVSELPDSVCRLAELNVVALKQSDIVRGEAVSATVLSHRELETDNITAIKGIADIVPNLYMPDYGSRVTSSIYVRGIGARMDQPAVGMTVDNVPLLNKNSFDFDMADIASVEMFRGPQSTLYGRNTIGGLINIETLSPMRWQGWRIMASGARGNDYKLCAGWYAKPSKSFATSLTLSGTYAGGFFRNQYTGRRLDHEKSVALRWKTEASLASHLKLDNAASVSFLRQGGWPYEYIDTGEISYNDPCAYRRFQFHDGLTLRWRGKSIDIASVTSVQYLDDRMTMDQDFLPEPYFTLDQKQRDFSLTEDLIFSGKSEGKYDWLAGVFFFGRRNVMEAPVMFKDKGIAELIEKNRNEANPFYPIAWDSRSFYLNSDFTLPGFGVAFYHESELQLGRWKLTAGLRLDWEKSLMDYRSYCNTGYQVNQIGHDGSINPYNHVAVDIDEGGKLSRYYFNWIPKLTALYSLPMEAENNVYVNISKGFKSGGFNTQMFSDVLQQRLMYFMGVGKLYDVDQVVGYKPEYSWNYELGAHLTFPSVSLAIDAAIFYIDCNDQQVTMFPSGTSTGRIMANAARTRSCGMEANATWEASRNWVFSVSYGYTDARFKKFHNGIDDFSGRRIPYVPENTLWLQAGYNRPLNVKGLKQWSVEANCRGTGKIYWNETNSESQPFYLLAGASATLEGNKWSVQLWGRNLTNTDYRTFYFKSMGNEFVQRGRPWQIGATLRLEL